MDGREDNGLTLEALAQKLERQTRRLETLERENERMRSENAALRDVVTELRDSSTRRDELAALRGSGTHQAVGPAADESEPLESEEGRVSRRWLLSKAGAAAVAAVAAGTLLNTREAKANHLNPGIEVDYVITHNENGVGVHGSGIYGVYGRSLRAGYAGVVGRNNIDPDGGIGVRGGSNGPNAIGVLGEGDAIGVKGTSSSPNLGAVEGHNDGGGSGVVGVGRTGVLAFSHTDGWNAAWGRHTTNGRGVAGDSARGTGVYGESTGGYGGEFKGGKAQLKLAPNATTGPPTGAHAKGEVYMDSTAALFVCVAGGNPATWRRVTTTAV